MKKKKEVIDNQIAIPFKLGGKLYHIGSDRYNFMYGIATQDKAGTGLRFTNDISCYASLESLLIALQERMIKTMPATTLLELQNNIVESKKMIAGIYGRMIRDELEE